MEKIKKIIDLLEMEAAKEAVILLGDMGLREPEKSLKNLDLLLKSGAFEEREEELIAEAVYSPDPDLALNNIERLATCVDREVMKKVAAGRENLRALLTLCGGSRFLTNIVINRPALLEWLLSEGNISRCTPLAEKLKTVREKLEEADNMASLQKALRCFKKREYLRIGVRDLLGMAPLTEVMEEISDLASACLQGAFEVSSAILKKEYGNPVYIDESGNEHEAGFVILGMGKLGGRELNFSSDIDLIFLYTTERGETAGVPAEGGKVSNRVSLHQFFVSLGKMIVRAMGEVTGDGFVFRVDMNLRPEGRFGDLACSLRSAEVYYESWGQTWERAAMLKARPVAGDIALGERFLEHIRPFIYRKHLDFGAIEEIGEMKRRIDARIARDDQLLTNVKLGTGGIREIEFFIQALQLINAGRRAAIREKNSLRALERLGDEGLISDDDEEKLSEAYRFLRTVEHRLQIFEERQTHTLPNDVVELERLARRAGCRKEPLEEFMNDHRRHTENVKAIYSRLFHEAAERLEEGKIPEILELLEGELGEDEAMERLSSYGFEDPERGLQNLSLLWNGPPFAHFTEAGRAKLRRVAPLIFREIISSPEPDMALNNLEKFISAVGARATLYSLLAENHHVVRLLIGLFGTSSFLSKILFSHPETLDSLVSPGASMPVKSEEMMREELGSLLDPIDDYEERLDTMRRFRNVEILRIGMNDIYEELSLEEVSSQLTALAGIFLETAYEMALLRMKERYGIPMVTVEGGQAEASFVIIGMGKLGGDEMSYSSDLDIIFVYSGSGETNGEYGGVKGLKIVSNHEFFSRLGQRIISILSAPTREGYAFRVDTRLRPSGSSGPLVASLDAFRDYHRKSARTWERQALVRARVVTGDPDLGRKVMAIIGDFVYGAPVTNDTVMEIDRIRRRMEFELAKEHDGLYNLKTGRGGLVDIEFIAQLLLLKYGAGDEYLRTPNTGAAIERLGRSKVLPEDERRVLSETCRFLRRVESRLRIVHDQPVSELDTNSRDFGRLARRLGYDGEGLLKEYRARTGKVREIYNRYFMVEG